MKDGRMNKKAHRWCSFTDARTFVRKLGLKSSAEWNSYCKSGNKPANIPSAPHYTYPTEFKGMGDWLGTGTIAPRDRHRQYRPFTEAGAFVHELGLKNNGQWRDYCRSGKKPTDIPVN